MHVNRFVNRFALMGLSILVAAPVMAQTTQIEIWHTLSGSNRAEFESMIDRFNGSQTSVSVDLSHYDDQAELEEDAAEAISGKRDKPDLVQLADDRSPQAVAQHKDILPLYRLLAKYPIADASWFLERTTDFVRDSRGQLLAFPYMAEVPVLFYNRDMYRAAGLDADVPPATWPDLQAHLLKLRNDGNVRCPYITADQVKVHIENLAPINDEFFVTPDNGLKSTRNLSFNFNTLYVRHMSLMVSWRKTDLLLRHSAGKEVNSGFTDGSCSVLTAGSGALGDVLNSSVSFGVAPVPYYAQETKKPGAPFIGGSALWVVNGHPAARQKATAELLAFLAKPVTAAQWHQKTGYLPLTDAAFRAADVSFYSRIPGARELIEQMRNRDGAKSAGFDVPNYSKIRPLFNAAFDQAVSGTEPPMTALMKAKSQGAKIAR
jgi:multiple sugar transport system substrate-binding protein